LSKTNCKIAILIGKSYLFQDFLIFDGERFIINFLFGSCILKFLKAALILSFASFIEASASQTISIVGKALLESASTVTKNHSKPKFATVNTFEIIKISL
jgi:hypothetical protein